MATLEEIAQPFVDMANNIVWAAVATVDTKGRPRTRVLHPLWELDDGTPVGWIMTGPTPIKVAHLNVTPHVSLNYWTPAHDTCLAECEAAWVDDTETKAAVWDKFLNGPEPVGYDPKMIPGWETPESETFAVLRLDPWRLRVMPAAAMLTGEGTLVWQKD